MDSILLVLGDEGLSYRTGTGDVVVVAVVVFGGVH